MALVTIKGEDGYSNQVVVTVPWESIKLVDQPDIGQGVIGYTDGMETKFVHVSQETAGHFVEAWRTQVFEMDTRVYNVECHVRQVE